MDKVNGKLTVYFEEPFRVGVFERIENGRLTGEKREEDQLRMFELKQQKKREEHKGISGSWLLLNRNILSTKNVRRNVINGKI